MKKIIYTRPDGGVSVVSPASNVVTDGKNFMGLTKSGVIPEGWRAATIEEIAKKDVPKGIAYEIVDESQIPSDRYFREAWKKSGASLTIDMEKAREIQKGILRDQRKPLLEALDVDFMKAVEEDNKAEIQKISKEKKDLRDVTDHPSIAAAQTPEALKALSISEILK